MGLMSVGGEVKTPSCIFGSFAANNRWYYTNMPDGKYFKKLNNNEIECLKKCKVRIKGLLGAYPEKNSVGVQLNGENMESFGYTGSDKYKEVDFEKDINVGDVIKQAFYYSNTSGDLAIAVSIDVI